MWISAATLIITTLTVLSATAGAALADEPAALFNGRDLTGWTYHLADPNSFDGRCVEREEGQAALHG